MSVCKLRSGHGGFFFLPGRPLPKTRPVPLGTVGVLGTGRPAQRTRGVQRKQHAVGKYFALARLAWAGRMGAGVCAAIGTAPIDAIDWLFGGQCLSIVGRDRARR